MKIGIHGHSSPVPYKVPLANDTFLNNKEKARTWTQDEMAQLANMRAEGTTYAALAKAFHCTERDVVNGLNRSQCRIYKKE